MLAPNAVLESKCILFTQEASLRDLQSLPAKNAPIKCDNANLLEDGILILVHKSDSDEGRNDKFNKEYDIQFIL